jgi:hypothetical protein
MQIQPDPSAFPYLIFFANERCEPHPDDVRRPEARTAAAAAVHDRGWRWCTSGRERGKWRGTIDRDLLW